MMDFLDKHLKTPRQLGVALFAAIIVLSMPFTISFYARYQAAQKIAADKTQSGQYVSIKSLPGAKSGAAKIADEDPSVNNNFSMGGPNGAEPQNTNELNMNGQIGAGQNQYNPNNDPNYDPSHNNTYYRNGNYYNSQTGEQVNQYGQPLTQNNGQTTNNGQGQTQTCGPGSSNTQCCPNPTSCFAIQPVNGQYGSTTPQTVRYQNGGYVPVTNPQGQTSTQGPTTSTGASQTCGDGSTNTQCCISVGGSQRCTSAPAGQSSTQNFAGQMPQWAINQFENEGVSSSIFTPTNVTNQNTTNSTTTTPSTNTNNANQNSSNNNTNLCPSLGSNCTILRTSNGIVTCNELGTSCTNQQGQSVNPSSGTLYDCGNQGCFNRFGQQVNGQTGQVIGSGNLSCGNGNCDDPYGHSVYPNQLPTTSQSNNQLTTNTNQAQTSNNTPFTPPVQNPPQTTVRGGDGNTNVQITCGTACTSVNTSDDSGTPAEQAEISLAIALPGIGNSAGLNNNPSGGAKGATLQIIDSTGTVIRTIKGNLKYDPRTGSFTGNIPVGVSLADGNYQIKANVDNSVPKVIATNAPLSQGKIFDAGNLSFTTGDINQDGQTNLLDYNIMISCVTRSCNSKNLADLNMDGKVDELDLNILYSNFLTRRGE